MILPEPDRKPAVSLGAVVAEWHLAFTALADDMSVLVLVSPDLLFLLHGTGMGGEWALQHVLLVYVLALCVGVVLALDRLRLAFERAIAFKGVSAVIIIVKRGGRE